MNLDLCALNITAEKGASLRASQCVAACSGMSVITAGQKAAMHCRCFQMTEMTMFLLSCLVFLGSFFCGHVTL